MPDDIAENGQEDDMRGDLEAAIGGIQDDDTRETSVSPDGLLPDAEIGAAAPEKDGTDPEKIEAAKLESEKDPEKQADGELDKNLVKDDKLDKEAQAAAGDGKDADKDKGLKAPAGWSPQAREEWSKVPPSVQKVITEREASIALAFQNTVDARQTHEQLGALAQSFAPIMAAEGVKDPMQAVRGLFETVAQLRVGSPEQKAMKMAGLIQHYGIDVQALDSALVGATPQASPDANMQNMIDQRMAPVNQLLSELQNRQQATIQQTQQQANEEISNFKGEFFEDVRMDMADLMDMASARNQNMTLQEAYDKAILLKPEIQSVIQKRAADAELLGNNQNIDNKRNAASTLTGKPAGEKQGLGEGASLRDTIMGAWEDQQGGGRI